MSDRKMLNIAVGALANIRDNQGKVCPEFETCNHPGCISSHSSLCIADGTLASIKVQSDSIKLLQAALKWWKEEASLMTVYTDDEYNVFSEDPDWVIQATKSLKKGSD